MRYDACLAAGMPVAAGVVASACGSVVKKRMEGEGAEAVLLLRSLEKSEDYLASWRFHAAQERKRLYKNELHYSPVIQSAQAA